MAFVYTEGFGASTSLGDYVNYGLMVSTSANSIQTNGPLGDNYLLHSYPLNTTTQMRYLSGNYSTFFYGARLKVDPGASTTEILFRNNGNTQLSVFFNGTSNVISVYRGDGVTLLQSSANSIFPINAWFYFEIGVVIAGGTSGSVTVRVNGVTVMTIPAANTQGDGTATTFNNLRYYSYGGSFSIAHTYVCDNTGPAPQNTFLGDVRVQTLVPTGAGSSTGFTPTGKANNYSVAGTVPPSPSTYYNSSSTVGATDLFTMPNMSATDTNILGVQVKCLMAKTDAGARTMATVMKSGTTTSQGSAVAPSTQSQYLVSTYSTDPNTGAQWTQSAVNAMQAGYTIVS